MPRTLVASDNFNRAGPGLGANWTQINNWAGGDCTIASSTVLQGAGGGASGSVISTGTIMWSGAGTFPDDQYSKATISAFDFQSTAYSACAMVRCSGDVNVNGGQMDYYAAVVFLDAASGGTHTTALVKVVNGTQTTLGATVGIVYSNADTVECEAEGTTIRFFKNGVEQYTRTDSSLTSGKPGVLLAGAGITTRLDDWEGGSLVAADPVVITTLPLSNNTGSLLASTSGISAFVHDPATGELVVLVTGLSTDADGVLEITDDLLEADTSYRVVIRVTGTGAEGMDTYTAV
jgi:hypothetical protein